jgi:hypothetical protein
VEAFAAGVVDLDRTMGLVAATIAGPRVADIDTASAVALSPVVGAQLHTHSLDLGYSAHSGYN